MSIARETAEVLESASWIRKMFEEGERLRRERGERNVFDLSLGNPNLEPPPEFKEALLELATRPIPGMHRYMSNAGYLETREAIARQYSGETGLRFEANDVVMTCGAGGGLNVVFKAILDPGDEVLVLAPYFAEYRFYVANHGGRIRPVATDAEFQPDLARIREAISSSTKALLVNSPNNPTGAVYRRDRLAAIGRLLEEESRRIGHTIYLVADEPYRRIRFDGVEVPHLFEFYGQTILVTSHSKDLGLAGERIGMILVGPEVSDRARLGGALVFVNRTLGFVNAPALMQRIVAKLQGVTVDVESYRIRRDRLHAALTQAGYEIVKPQGAFYMFPRSPVPDEVRFVMRLAREGVLVVPGCGFGTPGFFRISYAVDDWVVDGALPIFEKAMRETRGRN